MQADAAVSARYVSQLRNYLLLISTRQAARKIFDAEERSDFAGFTAGKSRFFALYVLKSRNYSRNVEIVAELPLLLTVEKQNECGEGRGGGAGVEGADHFSLISRSLAFGTVKMLHKLRPDYHFVAVWLPLQNKFS